MNTEYDKLIETMRVQEEKISRLSSEVNILHNKYERTLREVRQKENQITEIKNSVCWKITAPLRMVPAHKLVEKSFPYNTGRRMALDLFVLLLKEPSRFLHNLNKRNVVLFFQQIRRLQPSVLASEVRKKLFSHSIATSPGSANFDYFGLFTDPADKKRVLVIDRFIPAYDTNSGSLRMFTILSILSELGYMVTFIPEDLQPREPYVSELEDAGIEVVCGGVNMENFFREKGPTFSIVILSEPQPAFSFLPLARAYAVNSTVIYDTVDLHWVRLERAASLIKDKELLREAEYFRKTETFNMAASDLVLTVTNDEKEYLHSIDRSLSVEVLPNIHEAVKAEGPPFKQRKDIMFIGHYLHDPNVDAVTYFVRDVFPLLKKEIPEMKFHIVGSNPTNEVLKLRSEDVEVTGYVKDVSPYFENCRVFVAPLRFGAGMKGKIGQSMTFGLPVVTTTIGAEGMGLVNGGNALIADGCEEFAAAVLKLYNDEKLWVDISSAAKLLMEQNYSKKAISQKIVKILENIGRGGERQCCR